MSVANCVFQEFIVTVENHTQYKYFLMTKMKRKNAGVIVFLKSFHF